MANTQKNVELVIKARDDTRRALQSAKTALDGFAAAQARTAARRGQFAALKTEFYEVGASFEAASNRAAELGRKLDTVKRPTKAMQADFAAARAEARRLRDEMLGVAASAGRMNGRVGQAGSFAQFDSRIVAGERAETAARGVDRLGVAIDRVVANQQRLGRIQAYEDMARGANQADAALENLARDLPPVAAAQDRLAASTNRATGALNAQAAAGHKADLATRVTASAATRQGRGPLGLRPWEMQNLGYQVNDVITGLASGQAPMQVLAQQGGQIAQLFPAAVSSILRMVPALVAVTAVAAPFVAALNKAGDAAKNLKAFDQLLTRSGEGASYTAAELAGLAQRLDAAGASAQGARAAFSEFVNDSVAPDYLRRFGDTSQDVAKVLGIELVDAAKKVSDAFTGDADAILALDKELNFLTDTERDHIKLLRESKRDAEARTEAFAIFERRYGETADKMKGPWSTILKNFGSSWSALVDSINATDFGSVGAKWDWLIAKVASYTAMLPGANIANVGNTNATIDRETAQRNALVNQRSGVQARVQALETGPQNNRTRSQAAGQRGILNDLDAQIRRAESRLNYLRVRATTQDALNGVGLLGDGPAAPDTTLDPPSPANSSSGGGSRVSEAERLAKLQKEFNEDLIAQNAARAQDIANLQVAARQLEINTAVEQARAKALDDGLTFSTDQATAIADSVGSLYDARVEQEGFNAISAAALELAERRGEVEERSAYISRQLAEERLTIETAIGRTRADQLGQMYDLDQKARDLVNSEKSVNDLLARRTELQSQLTFASDQGDVAGAEALRLQLEALNAQLLLAVNNSILFMRSLGGAEAEIAILRLQGIAAEVGAVDRQVIVTGKQIDEMIANGGVNAFNQFWDAVGQGANAFDSARDAFLAFAADFIKQIAAMILKQALLNALQSAGGGKGGGGIGATIASAVASVFSRHDGGLIGSGGGMRRMPLAAFAGATRYHTGGVIGLKPNERPVISELGEEMLTEDDPRHRKNLGGGNAAGGTKVINLFDPAAVAESMLQDHAGQQVFFNFVRQNARTFNAALKS